jgi:hypothetical protein
MPALVWATPSQISGSARRYAPAIAAPSHERLTNYASAALSSDSNVDLPPHVLQVPSSLPIGFTS